MKMRKDRVIYISDQKYYVTKSKEWFTTASFPLELILSFDGIKQWTFFGRLQKINNNQAAHLFKLPSKINSIKVIYSGIWISDSTKKWYLSKLLNYCVELYKQVNKNEIFYLKFSFLASYIVGLLLNKKKAIVITHLVGDLDCLFSWKLRILNQVALKIQQFLFSVIVKKAYLQIYVSKCLMDKYSSGKAKKSVICESRIKRENIKKFHELHTTKIESKTLKLLFVGRLSYEKGLQEFLFVVSSIKCLRLDIVGEGFLKIELQKSIEKLHLEKRVRFLGYIKWGSKLFDLFSQYNYLILPSFSEGCPLVVVEAMSMGLPVIATSVGGIPEIICDYENGVLITPRDLRYNIKKVKTLIDNVTLHERITKNGLDTVMDFTLESQMEKLRKLLTDTIYKKHE